MSSYGYTSATVVPFEDFNPEQDAEMLRKAMKGFGTDEQTIIDILAQRTNEQRLQIYDIYKSSFGRDLIDDLKSELSGKFEDIIMATMTPTIDYLARELHRAISGIGTDEEALVEIMASCCNAEVDDLKSAYEKLYEKSLEDDMIGDTSGHFRKLLVSLCCAMRDESDDVDPDQVTTDAEALFSAGEDQWGTDEAVFNKILVNRGYWHLMHVFGEYEKIAGRSIEQTIENETTGELQMGLLTVVKCVSNKPAYFAERLYNAMKGMGTDDHTLIRIIAVRSERDMALIKDEFETAYGRTLEHYIAGDTSGDCKGMLLALVRG